MTDATGHRCARCSEGSLSLTEYRGQTGFRTLEKEWRSLTEHDARYSAGYEWISTYLAHGPEDPETAIFLAVRDEHGVVQAIVPLEPVVERIRRIPFRAWTLLGSAANDVALFGSQCDIPALDHQTAVFALDLVRRHLGHARTGASLLMLGRVAPNSNAHFAASAAKRRTDAKRDTEGWKSLAVDRSFPELKATLSGKFKISLRSCLRNLLAMGPVSFGTSRRGDTDFSDAFEEFLRIESSGWKGPSGTNSGLGVNPFQSQRLALQDLTRLCDVEIHWLRVGAQVVASQFWMRYASTRVAFRIGYDEAFSRFQPGHLLLEHVLRLSCQDPLIREVDFVSAANWLDKWRPTSAPHSHFTLGLGTVVGHLALSLLRLPTYSQIRNRLAR